MNNIPQTLLRLPDVLSISGLARTSLYDRIKHGLWPKPVNLGGRAVGWPSNEVAAVIAARISGKTNDEIRHIISELQADRKNAR